MEALRQFVIEIPNHPKPGVNFKDITPLLENAACWKKAVQGLAERFAGHGIDKVVGIEARGFGLAGAVARELDAGFVLVRKNGKLPRTAFTCTSTSEYGSSPLQIHCDSIRANERGLIIDDVLATGGTAFAALQLIGMACGVVVGLGFLIELSFLLGRKKFPEQEVFALLRYYQ